MSRHIQLTLGERLSIVSQLIPTKGAFEDLIVGKDLRKKVELTQEEVKKFNVKTEVVDGVGARVKWNIEDPEKDSFDIDFTELEFKMVKDSLVKKSEEKELPMELVGLYRKFDK